MICGFAPVAHAASRRSRNVNLARGTLLAEPADRTSPHNYACKLTALLEPL